MKAKTGFLVKFKTLTLGLKCWQCSDKENTNVNGLSKYGDLGINGTKLKGEMA